MADSFWKSTRQWSRGTVIAVVAGMILVFAVVGSVYWVAVVGGTGPAQTDQQPVEAR
jgi:hypothetical protein